MLKFSANLSLLFTEIALLDRFQAARQHGFDAVEIQFPYALNPATLAAALAETGLKLVLFNVAADDLLQGGSGLACVPEQRSRFRDAVAEALAYARLLQPVAVNVLPGRCPDAQRLPVYLDTLYDNLHFAAGQFADIGVKTVFEAINTVDMPGFIIHSGSQMLDTLARVRHDNLFMQCDVYHLRKMGESPDAFIMRHADQIGHIQFADEPGRGQPGTGAIDFASLFSAIERSGYSGWVGAEYKPVGATADSLAWLRNGESVEIGTFRTKG